MKAIVYNGPRDVSVSEVPDPTIERPTDVLVKITSTNICGSDPHRYEGRAGAEPGLVIGRENLGEVAEIGSGIDRIRGQAAYAAAKHGVVGLTNAAALDYAQSNIRINAVHPGIIETSMMNRFTGGTPEGREGVIAQEPIGRMGKPEEIAAAVLWLCSDAVAFVVGHALVVDGAQTV